MSLPRHVLCVGGRERIRRCRAWGADRGLLPVMNTRMSRLLWRRRGGGAAVDEGGRSGGGERDEENYAFHHHR